MDYEAELGLERRQLSDVRKHIERQLRASGAEIKLTDDFTEMAINAMRSKEVEQLRRSRSRPYFAKLDFQEQGQPYPEQAYIGRFGLYERETMNPIVLDWRSPMAGLYYEHSFKDVPVQIKHGLDLRFDIERKRQFEMEDDEISRFFDMTSASGTNRLLLERLEQRGEQKLRDIVETIQAEQNAVLRADARQALIVQGAAGSGKTTIALHRLAFLAYSYRERGTFDNFLIIAPNRLFIDYISDVLPDLGIEGVVQTTWEDCLIPFIPLPKQVKFFDNAAKTALFLEHRDSQGGEGASAHSAQTILHASKLRGTMAMKKLLDRYIEKRVEQIVPEADLALSKAHKLTHEEIRRKFNEDFKHYPYMQRRKRLLAVLKQWTEDCLKEAVFTLESRVKQGQYTATQQRVAEVTEQYRRKYQEYAEKLKGVEIAAFYRNIMSKPSNIALLIKYAGGEYAQYNAEEIAAYFADLKASKPRELEWDDIAPLFYLAYKFYGLGKTRAYSHIIVDEAQDFAPFQLFALRHLSSGGSMTILGDLAQSIYPYRGLTNWDDLREGVFETAVSVERLKKSYRSTVEIMTAANGVLSHWNNPHVTLAEPVLRHGEEPMLARFASEGDAISGLAAAIRELQEAGMPNIAVIDKTVGRCREVHKQLSKAGVEARLIAGRDTKYEGGVSVVPIYLSKGMEFDTVILINPSARLYDAGRPEDVKLLYVAMTRALHRLYVYYWDGLSPLLEQI
ncbi:HelD family protein [Paenibacillus thermotolerans]|uniref:HelD family protein n=1 Tax=Paenibacillus thermotolerans TaxID=3027807 RepID=UPI0023678F24|nr:MULTISPECIES: 3'-5' exonuclease [unclassified Paenibacillus]